MGFGEGEGAVSGVVGRFGRPRGSAAAVEVLDLGSPGGEFWGAWLAGEVEQQAGEVAGLGEVVAGGDGFAEEVISCAGEGVVVVVLAVEFVVGGGEGEDPGEVAAAAGVPSVTAGVTAGEGCPDGS